MYNKFRHITLELCFHLDDDDKKNDKENNDGIYNYDAPSNKQEQDNLTPAAGYTESPRARRRRVQNPQHIKLIVRGNTKHYNSFFVFDEVSLFNRFKN